MSCEYLGLADALRPRLALTELAPWLPDHDCGALGHHGDVTSLVGPQRLDIGSHFLEPVLQRRDLVGQLDNAFDPSQIDALVLRQTLHFAEQLDVVLRITAPTTGTTAGADEAEPVIGTQRLRMHTGQLGGHRDQKSPRFVFFSHQRLPAHPARGSKPPERSATA